jgi:ATP-binding cassette subfamily C (CFTR/MRP) protein 1
LLNIARTLLNPKKIVLVDEATANIDIKSDETVQRVLQRAFSGRTVLTIAHRIGTVLHSDRILVLDNGRIAELDSPQALLAAPDSLFARLYE